MNRGAMEEVLKIPIFISAQLCTGGDLVVDHNEVQLLLTLFGVNGAEQHAAGGLAHHLSGGQVGDGHQSLANQLTPFLPIT